MTRPSASQLRRATRVTVAACIAFFIGRYALNDSQLTVLATFGVIAMMGLADIRGHPATRTFRYLAITAGGLVTVAVGTTVSEVAWQAALAMLLVVFVTAFCSIASGAFANAANPVILFYVVASGIPEPASVLGSRLAGVLLGSAAVIVTSLVVFPKQDEYGFRRHLASASSAVAGAVGSLIGRGVSDAPGPTAALAAAQAELTSARTYLSVAAVGPSGPTQAPRSQMHVLHGLERIVDITARLTRDRVGPQDDGVVLTLTEALLDRVRTVLESAGDAFAGSGPPVRPGVLQGPEDDLTTAAEAHFAQVLSRGDTTGTFGARLDRSFLVCELGRVATMVAAHTAVATGWTVADPSKAVGGPGLAVAHAGVAGPDVAKWWRRIRSNLTWESVHLQNSVRLALGLGIARYIVGIFDLQHGFWVVFATLTVLKSTASQTRANGWRAILGTLAGFAISTLLVLTVGVNDTFYSVLLPPVIFAGVLASSVGLATGQALFTLLVVILFNLLRPAGWDLGLARLEDVVVGVLVGLAIGAAIWPRGATGQLRRCLARSLDAGACYAAAVARSRLGVLGDSDPDTERKVAFAAGVHVEDVFAQYLAERTGVPLDLGPLSDLVLASHRLWYSAHVVASGPPVGPGLDGLCPSFLAALAAGTSALQSGYHSLAQGVATRSPVTLPTRLISAPDEPGGTALACQHRLEELGDTATLHAAVRAFELRAWIAELGQELVKLAAAGSGAHPELIRAR